jgi:hypothetical protein
MAGCNTWCFLSWCVIVVKQPGMRAFPAAPIVGLLWIIGIPANVGCALAPRQPVLAGAIAYERHRRERAMFARPALSSWNGL